MVLTTSEVTRLLDAWSDGDVDALDKLMPLVFDELHKIARRQFWKEPANHTLQPTAVVAELYLKFKGERNVQLRSRAKFFGVASKKIRHILVDSARKRQAGKRGGEVLKISFEEAFALSEDQDPELIALDDALQDLANLDARQSRIVELRIFGGLEFKEIAKLLDTSRTTVWRDWKTALPWLRRELDRRSDSQM